MGVAVAAHRVVILAVMTRTRPRALVFAVTAFTLIAGACTTPGVGTDPAETGRLRVVELVNEAGAVLPAHATLGTEVRSEQTVKLGFIAVTQEGVERENCYRKFLGYSAGKSGSIQPEIRTIVDLPLTTDPATLLPLIQRRWEALGYKLDTSKMSDKRYPQIQAHVGEYRVYATALSEAAGFAGAPRLTMYAVSPCQRTTPAP